MLCFPLDEFDVQPEAVNAERDNRQQNPLDPMSEQLQCSSRESQSVAIDDGMLCFPAVDHTKSPRITNTEGDACNDCAENFPSDQLQQTSVKVRFFCLNSHGFFLRYYKVISIIT